ncbi:glycoside hydrolase [Thamnocephalis sphaerospora]|uniref:Mannosyl-oligosaccharide glucosidase n=1 Tax=Thamnocephalis sphaerospora TaxID=78915 RepID=A0A4P9XJI6_9FUNG|nr:glycoside hydrolase [Thamnocephalis sphaerospora]|eukprot:RKP05923.1 glycoside hydrolase [Thamnocephalis sphaerospora]
MLELRLSAERAANATLFWGTYRPNLYFGTRPRLPHSVMTGLMWYTLEHHSGFRHIRHTCEQGEDDLERFGYVKHDGRFFGVQELVDPEIRYSLKTEFVKQPGGDHGGNWAVRISGTPNVTDTHPAHASIIFYLGFDGIGDMELVNKITDNKGFTEPINIIGDTEGLDKFNFKIVDAHHMWIGPNSTTVSRVLGMRIVDENLWRAKELLEKHLVSRVKRLVPHDAVMLPTPEALFTLDHEVEEGSNIFMIQKNVQGSFQFDVIFKSGSSPSPLQGGMDASIQNAYDAYDARFEKIFGLAAKGYTKSRIKFAQTALSNLIGGIGYFYGDSIVDHTPEEHADRDELDEDEFTVHTPHPEKTKPMSLFSGTPSRSFFPRGFLWDEGFHQILVGHWDNDLSLEIIRSWFALMDDHGWIAREQILGEEARSKVPEKFQIQFPNYANPPTLIIPLAEEADAARKRIVSSGDPEVVRNRHLLDPRLGTDYLLRIYPYLRRFYQWFRRTQKGEIKRWGRSAPNKEAYRWRGRTLNHTLTSGLDDYPRAVPHQGELHLDLLCWMGYMAKTLRMVAERLEEHDDADEYDMQYNNILANIDALHWDEDEEIYCDLTVDADDESEFVCHRGYITLFPLLLGLLPPDSPRLEPLLDLMHDPDHLWTSYGLRSLSKQDPNFGEGENYWRGPIWMNMNYLALAALHKNYIHVDGPYQAKAAKIYQQLRSNVVRNLYKQFRSTGFLWEQYAEKDGAGQRAHPFSGWTALIVLIMAEKY